MEIPANLRRSPRRVEMRRVAGLSVAVMIGFLGVLTCRPAWATTPLQYHGGPFLENFTIYPLYYGGWSQTDLTTQQTYVVNLDAYMSGVNAPGSEQPVMRQYGVNQWAVAAAATASPTATPTVLSRKALVNIIHTNQTSGNLPPFGPNTLIVIFSGARLQRQRLQWTRGIPRFAIDLGLLGGHPAGSGTGNDRPRNIRSLGRSGGQQFPGMGRWIRAARAPPMLTSPPPRSSRERRSG